MFTWWDVRGDPGKSEIWMAGQQVKHPRESWRSNSESECSGKEEFLLLYWISIISFKHCLLPELLKQLPQVSLPWVSSSYSILKPLNSFAIWKCFSNSSLFTRDKTNSLVTYIKALHDLIFPYVFNSISHHFFKVVTDKY